MRAWQPRGPGSEIPEFLIPPPPNGIRSPRSGPRSCRFRSGLGGMQRAAARTAQVRNPITVIAACCARAPSGHAVAALPPSSVMNSRRSFDHLVGNREQAWRKRQAECLGSLEIEDQLELGRLYDGQIGGLFPLEYPANVDADEPIRVSQAGSITHQAAGRGELARLIEGRNCVTCRQRHNLMSPTGTKRIDGNKNRFGMHLQHCCESGVDLVFVAGIEDRICFPITRAAVSASLT